MTVMEVWVAVPVGLDEDLERRFGLVPFLGGEGFVVGEFLGHHSLGHLPKT